MYIYIIYQRIDRLIESTYLLDYCLNQMGILTAEEDEELSKPSKKINKRKLSTELNQKTKKIKV